MYLPARLEAKTQQQSKLLCVRQACGSLPVSPVQSTVICYNSLKPAAILCKSGNITHVLHNLVIADAVLLNCGAYMDALSCIAA